jgi:phosphatidylserine/phosphatidylglycerophosphate/cardiolipin synthase-like enzyme
MSITLCFGARPADAADGLVRGLRRAVDLDRGAIDVVSHALDHPPLVDRLAACRALGARVRLVVEGANLVEDVGRDHWRPGGDGEALRQAVCALWRSNITVRLDRRAALLHANLVLSETSRSIFVTSANLTDKGLTRDHNCGVRLDAPPLYDGLHDAFDALWRGGFEAGTFARLVETADGALAVRLGSRVGVDDPLVELIASARKRLRFAMFTFSNARADVVAALAALAARGVDVAGVVDGDQFGQPFDAVPTLRAAGVDARYVPGALTGGVGRMHHKLVVVDGHSFALGTANFSASAADHCEVSVTARGPDAADAAASADAEIEGLHRGARLTMALP